MKTNFRLVKILVLAVMSLFLVAETMAAVNTYDSDDVPKFIPDKGKTTSSLNVPDSLIIEDVDVVITITHGYDADLDVFLVGPDGTKVELFTDCGGSGKNFLNTTLDDEATMLITTSLAPYINSYQPEGKLSDFDGLNAEGTWQLEVKDDDAVLTGKLRSWSLVIEGGPPPVEPVEPADRNQIRGNLPGCGSRGDHHRRRRRDTRFRCMGRPRCRRRPGPNQRRKRGCECAEPHRSDGLGARRPDVCKLRVGR